MKRGNFIVFEGIDGSGKTTQAKLLADTLNASYTQEPTSYIRNNNIFLTKLITNPYSFSSIALVTQDRINHVNYIKKLLKEQIKGDGVEKLINEQIKEANIFDFKQKLDEELGKKKKG